MSFSIQTHYLLTRFTRIKPTRRHTLSLRTNEQLRLSENMRIFKGFDSWQRTRRYAPLLQKVFHLKESGEASSCSGTTEAAPKRKGAGRRTRCLRPRIERFAWKMLIESLHCSRNAILIFHCSCEYYSASFHIRI